ncbi:hypothetical protein H072_5436 [Dactylellina haptotyla CBS 200.50]|uniref:Cytochrome P450 n=1 Tax=Dactylellina haptotyla (strain CBS 200.50) TaxID=1284197 RepID=S8BMH9_DACHA|nr:hypothetical protein H072_5436 [Dactylellina haptotyla CBS 200.50]
MNSSIPISDSLRDLLSLVSLTPANIALYGVLAAALPLVFTYTVSSLNDGKPTKDGEPPVPPYWFPFVGHGFALMGGMDKMMSRYRKTDGGPGKPKTLTVFGKKMYLISDPGSILLMWRKSKSVVFEPLLEFTLKQLFGGNDAAARVLNVGSPGVDQTGLEGEMEWMKFVHQMYIRELGPSTPGLENMTNVYLRELNKEIEKLVGKETKEIDLFAWVKKIMFPASGRALYGYKLDLGEEMAYNFWNWDAGFLQLVKFYPDFMIPGVRASRDRVLDALVKWRMEVKDLRDKIDDDVVWEENFGARLIRDRVKLTEQVLAEDDHRGHASIHLSIFWGLEANAIPVACWTVAFALLTPGLFERLKAEVSTAVLPPVEGSSMPSWDVDMLVKLPLLNAVWQESMRLCVSSLSPRVVIEDTEIDGYIYKKGGMVQGMSPIVQLEEEYWGKDVLEFNPDRWLPFPGESASAAGKRIRDYQSKVRPFGGGVSICPGRHFAGQEILATVAVFVTAFEWEMEGKKAPEVNRDYFGAGGLPPKSDVRLKVKRI